MPTVSYRYDNQQNNFQLNGWEAEDQTAPDVIGLDDGGFAVLYTTDGVNDHVLYSFFDPDYDIETSLPFGNYGIPYDDVGDIGGSRPDVLGAAKLTKLNNGNIVAVWDEGPGSGGDDDLVAAIISPTGAIVTAD